jgi:hypothetical protein
MQGKGNYDDAHAVALGRRHRAFVERVRSASIA